MQIDKLIYRLEYLKELIEKECTGTPQELAVKLGVSERMVFHYLDELKKQGLELYYCRTSRTYKLKNNMSFLK